MRKTVSKRENGLFSPSAEQLIHLSKLLDVLLGRLEKMNEAGVKALFDMVMLFSDRVGGRKWFYLDHVRMFARLIMFVVVPADVFLNMRFRVRGCILTMDL